MPARPEWPGRSDAIGELLEGKLVWDEADTLRRTEAA
jgi:hypothetical protein